MSTTNAEIPYLSTDTPLIASGVFTSIPVYIGQYQSVSWAIATDTTTEVLLQYSSNAVDWDTAESFIFYASDSAIDGSVYMKQKYIRTVVTNQDGANPQTYLRFSVYGLTGLAVTKVDNIEPTQLNELEIHTAASVASVTTVFVNVSKYSAFRFTCIGDSAGSVELKWSMDGVTNTLIETLTLVAATGIFHHDVVKAKYLRITYLQTVTGGDLDSQLFFDLGADGGSGALLSSASFLGENQNGDFTWTNAYQVIDVTTNLSVKSSENTSDWTVATSGIAEYTYNGVSSQFASITATINWSQDMLSPVNLQIFVGGVAFAFAKVGDDTRTLTTMCLVAIDPADVVQIGGRLDSGSDLTTTFISVVIDKQCC